jgi:spore maturation protein CgeB
VCHRYGPIFCFYPDDAFTPERYTLRAAEAMKRFDCVLTTKSFNVPELHTIGIPVARFVNKFFHPKYHHPAQLTDEERRLYASDVTFIGNGYNSERADFLATLVEACPEVNFNVWGHWRRLKNPLYWFKAQRYRRWSKLYQRAHGPVNWQIMNKVFAASKINLGLLYPGEGPTRIRDYQTQRSVEIPACGGFMLAEYTDEHQALFAEDREAVYFRSFDDLVAKIKYYLNHDDERIQIAQAGLKRAVTSGYTSLDRARTVLEEYRKWCARNGLPDKTPPHSVQEHITEC